MHGILVDTSVWIDLFRGEDNPAVRRLEAALENRIDICLCGLVRTEILQGITADAEYAQIRKLLGNYRDVSPRESTYLLAADIYRKGRAQGITVRKTIDCIIAALAIENALELLHNDKDFDNIALITTLKVHT